MSMIIKNDHQEVELGQKETTIARYLGMETGLSKTEIIAVLKRVAVHLAAKGEQSHYTNVKNVVDELTTWDDTLLTIEL